MKIKFLVRKAQHKPGTTVEINDGVAEWLIRNGYAEQVKAKASEPRTTTGNNNESVSVTSNHTESQVTESPIKINNRPADDQPKPRRGRPRKDAS